MPEINDSQLGDYIKNILDKNKWSIRKGALQIGVSAAYLSKLINHKADSNPKPATLRKLASGLHVSPEELFELAGIKLSDTSDSDKPEYVDLKKQINDKKKIMTFEGRIIPDEDLEYMERLLRGGKKD